MNKGNSLADIWKPFNKHFGEKTLQECHFSILEGKKPHSLILIPEHFILDSSKAQAEKLF